MKGEIMSAGCDRPQTPVESATRNLSAEVEILDRTIDSLHSRLEISLTPAPLRPECDEKSSAPAPCKSALVYEIDGQAGRVRAIRERIESILDRCQL